MKRENLVLIAVVAVAAAVAAAAVSTAPVAASTVRHLRAVVVLEKVVPFSRPPFSQLAVASLFSAGLVESDLLPHSDIWPTTEADRRPFLALFPVVAGGGAVRRLATTRHSESIS